MAVLKYNTIHLLKSQVSILHYHTPKVILLLLWYVEIHSLVSHASSPSIPIVLVSLLTVDQIKSWGQLSKMQFCKDKMVHIMWSQDIFDKSIAERIYSRVLNIDALHMSWKRHYKTTNHIQRERAMVSVHLCHSPDHSMPEPWNLNTQTKFVSPQFHWIFYDSFETVVINIYYLSLLKEKRQTKIPE